MIKPALSWLCITTLAIVAACSTVVDNSECKQDESCDVCIADGQEYDVGAVFADYCGSCVCRADGEFHCSASDECSCVVDDVEYLDGETWPDPKGCGVCSCFEGEANCEAAMCASCSWGEQEYQTGDEFPAGDGCNTCTCADEGIVSCTMEACACDPSVEWWKSYVANSPDECAAIDYTCPGLTTPFQNECGCGCEQSQECLQVYDCKPPAPCDLMWIEENCPFSMVAL